MIEQHRKQERDLIEVQCKDINNELEYELYDADAPPICIKCNTPYIYDKDKHIMVHN